MLLAIDLGNTNTVFGVYDAADKLVMHWRLSTQKERTVDEYGILLRNLFAFEKIDAKKITRVIIASVVPPLRKPGRYRLQLDMAVTDETGHALYRRHELMLARPLKSRMRALMGAGLDL